MSDGAPDRHWTLRSILRLPGGQPQVRTKVRDSIVVIGVTQAMLLGLLSTESDSSSGEESVTSHDVMICVQMRITRSPAQPP